METSPSRDRNWIWGLLVSVWALAVRLAYLAEMGSSPTFDVRLGQGSDQYTYFFQAAHIAQGDLIGSGPFNQSPFYPYFLALIFRLSGGENLLVPRLAQALLGVLLVYLTYRLARKLAGELAGVCAGLILASYGPMILYETAFLRDALLGLCFLGLVMALIRTRERPGLAGGLLVGSLFALSFLNKPTILVMVGILPWWGREIYLHVGRRALTLTVVGVLIGAALFLSPLWLRNRAAGVPLWSSTQRGALEFITGNYPGIELGGWNLPPSAADLDRQCRQSMGCAMVEILKLHRDHPLGLVWMQFVKLGQLLSGYEIPNNINYYLERRYSRLLALPWINWPPLLALGLIGLGMSRKKWREAPELFAYLPLMAVATVGFYIIDRFRLPLVPALAVFAGIALNGLAKAAAKKEWRTVAPAALFAAAVMIAAWPRPIDPLGPMDYHNVVRYHLIKKEPERARAWADEGLAKSRLMLDRRDDASGRFRLARILYLSGAPLAEVETELERAEKLGPPAGLAVFCSMMKAKVRQQGSEGAPKIEGFRLQ